MLPTTPVGHTGAPLAPGGSGPGGTPSRASARRAQCRPVTNSRRRFSTALARAAYSEGNSTASGGSAIASAVTTLGGRISLINRSPRRNFEDQLGGLLRRRGHENVLLRRCEPEPALPENIIQAAEHGATFHRGGDSRE
jgi:hypothetical protein